MEENFSTMIRDFLSFQNDFLEEVIYKLEHGISLNEYEVMILNKLLWFRGLFEKIN